MRPLIIFDFDGTLIDSLECFCDVANEALIEMGYKETLDTETVRQAPIQKLLRSFGIPFWKVPVLAKHGRTAFAKRLVRLQIHPRLATTLRRLAKKADLGIVSSNSAQNIRKVLENHEVDDLFAFIEEGSVFGKNRTLKRVHKASGKPRTLYVGDEPRDVIAARRAGMQSCAVTWGYADTELLLQVRPTMIASTPPELEKLVSAWIAQEL